MDKGYRQLLVWRAAMSLVEATYELTRRLPDDQRFGLTSQIQRAAVSIPSNIAEGHARRQSKDYARHLRIAAGSLAEWETQAELIVRLGYADRDAVRPAWDVSQNTARMLSALIRSVAPTPRQKPRQRDGSSQNPNA